MFMLNKVTLSEILKKALEKQPLVQQLTNMVSAQTQADFVAILGGVSIMSESVEEVEEIARKSDALLINIGTPNGESPELFRRAVTAAQKKGIPAVLDPVGYGFTELRVGLTNSLLEWSRFSIIRGNSAEISALAGTGEAPKGVSSGGKQNDMRPVVEKLAKKYGCTVSASGVVDTISDGETTLCLHGGSSLTATLSGIGCALGSCTALYSAVASPFEAALAAHAAFRFAAQLAADNTTASGSFYRAFQDELYGLHERNLDWRELLV